MKLRVFSRNLKVLERVIRRMNIQIERPWLMSGAIDSLDLYGYKIEGGAYVRTEVEGRWPVIGWGVAFNSGEYHLYVKPGFRGMKVGSLLIDFAKENFPEHDFCPWNNETSEIFKHKRCNVTSRYFE